MKRVLKVAVGLLLVVLLLAAGAYLWAKAATAARLAKVYETHRVDFPIPFPLTAEEIALLPDGTDPATYGAIATDRAKARGEHLVSSRYGCTECHGQNFGGGTMIDAPPLGRILGLNLTSGAGGVVAKYTASDWDRMVRHGVHPDGTPSVMPSIDFAVMSDRELSDIVTLIHAQKPVDNQVPRPVYGPIGYMLMATNKILMTAETIEHQAAHRADEPDVKDQEAFGKHFAQTCAGCHRADFSGGPIVGGDPDWPPAANLTPNEDGLAGWSFEDFTRAIRESKSKDGRELKMPMSGMAPYAKNMKPEEVEALWAYLKTVPKKPKSK